MLLSHHIHQIKEKLIDINKDIALSIDKQKICSEQQSQTYYAQMGILQKNLEAIETKVKA